MIGNICFEVGKGGGKREEVIAKGGEFAILGLSQEKR